MLVLFSALPDSSEGRGNLSALADYLTEDWWSDEAVVTVDRDKAADSLSDPAATVTAVLGTVTAVLQLAGGIISWRMLRSANRRGSGGIRVQVDGESITLEEFAVRYSATESEDEETNSGREASGS